MNETEAIKLAQKPQDIISPKDCNEITSYLNEYINVLVAMEWDNRLVASQKRVELLNTPNKTNAVAKAEWEISESYIVWQESLATLRKFRAYKADLRDRFSVLSNQQRRY